MIRGADWARLGAESVRVKNVRIAVVGGGPGGSRAAELLARRGARVVLYEPRSAWEKPCGGGVPERGLESCPFLRAPSLPQKMARNARIHSPSGREAIVPLAEPLRIYSRRDLNACFLDRALSCGVDLRASRVTGVDRSGSGWELRDSRGGSERFDFLIGADGASGIVRGRVDREKWARDQSVGVGYYVEGFTSEEIVLKFFSGLDGYFWVFPRADHLAVGICGPTGSGQGEALLQALQRFLMDLYGGSVLRRITKYGARIPSLPGGVPVRRACQGKGWALVGDAAGFVDPLTREGIYYAIASAELLAEALIEGKPDAYGVRWERRYGGELGWASGHRDLFYSRRFIESFTLLAANSCTVQRVVSDLIAGRQPYVALRRRLARQAPAAAGSLALLVLRRILFGSPQTLPPSLTPLAG